MIPVLGVPVLNRYDLLTRMEQTVDTRVGRYYVVDNGRRYPGETARMDCGERVVVDLGTNIGVAESWNLIIRANLFAPWWAISATDTEFGDGDLERLAQHMDAAEGPMCARLLGFGAFAVNAEAIERVGWFDPHYHPIYAEDSDWLWRAVRLGVSLVNVPSSTKHTEGGSVSIKQPGTDNDRTYPMNVAYHRSKWGGPPWEERSDAPLDGTPIDAVTVPRLSWLRDRAWR